jgi:chemotaxis response regulator CheB
VVLVDHSGEHGFRLILDAEPGIEVIAEAADGGQAVEKALESRPDVVLMDIRMPALDGIQATKQLLARLATTRVVMLTTFGFIGPEDRNAADTVIMNHGGSAAAILGPQRRGREARRSGRRRARPACPGRRQDRYVAA